MDPCYEFDAPLYIDFERVRDGTESEGVTPVDHWFSNHSHLEEDIRPQLILQPKKQHTHHENIVTTTPLIKKEEPECRENEDKDKMEHDKEVSAMSEDVKPLEEVMCVKTERESISSTSTGTQPSINPAPLKLGQKRSAVIASLQTPLPKQQKLQRNSSKKAAIKIYKMLKPLEKHPATSARTPEHLRRYLAKKQSQVKKTREDLEEEEMEKIQAETKKKLRQSRKSFHRLIDSTKKPPKVVKHTKPTTESVEFRFRTDRRLRQQGKKCTPRPPIHPSTFPMTLRSANNEIEIPRKVTKAKPFNFKVDSLLQKREARKREEGEQEGEEKKKSDHVPAAEFVFKFHMGSPPERFRPLPRRSLRSVANESTNNKTINSSCNVTMPYTPKLQTMSRARPTLVKSTAELEEEEMSKIRENPIKPLPLNPNIFNKGGLLGVPAKLQHTVTDPHTPKLATKERVAVRNEGENGNTDTKEQTSFKAQPHPKSIFEKVTGLPEKAQYLPTCPKSPALALKERNLHRSDDEEEQGEKCQMIIARPVPDFSHKFEPQLTHEKTEPQPFGFEERYKNKPNRATLVQQILDSDKREPFKANPIPDFEDGPILPTIQPQPVTEPKTPNLKTKTRGKVYESKWKQKLDDIAQKAKENAEFRARDVKILYKLPFKPAKIAQPMTEVSNVILHTDIRSEQRAKFDAEREDKERQQETENREREAQAEAVEVRRVTELRQSLVHKALPVRHYAPTVVLPSSKSLTAPHSPNFQLRLRGLH